MGTTVKGFSLLEVLMASIVLVLVVTIGNVLFRGSKVSQIASYDRLVATTKALELLNQLEIGAINIGVPNLPLTSQFTNQPKFIMVDKARGSFFNGDPFLRSASSYQLTSIDPNYQRLFSISPADCNGANCKDYRLLEVMTRWKFNSKEFNRSLTLRLIVGPMGLNL